MGFEEKDSQKNKGKREEDNNTESSLKQEPAARKKTQTGQQTHKDELSRLCTIPGGRSAPKKSAVFSSRHLLGERLTGWLPLPESDVLTGEHLTFLTTSPTNNRRHSWAPSVLPKKTRKGRKTEMPLQSWKLRI